MNKNVDDGKSAKIKNRFSNNLSELKRLENSGVLTTNDAPLKMCLSVVNKIYQIHPAQFAIANFYTMSPTRRSQVSLSRA